ncbi:hypothetical protein LCGC14_1817000 [marine sediment metagenome]|uniref:Uncharacterized protein n=1 Tax=marine sediment metagenome TaxID=412755 RepID=A0A0F9GK24_9ZZZZ
MSSPFQKFFQDRHFLNFIGSYFHCLRKTNRKEDLDVTEYHKEFANMPYMNKLIKKYLLKKEWLCTECHLCYIDLEDYYNHLPLILVDKDNNIELICNDETCRESAIKRIINSGRVLVEYETDAIIGYDTDTVFYIFSTSIHDVDVGVASGIYEKIKIAMVKYLSKDEHFKISWTKLTEVK